MLIKINGQVVAGAAGPRMEVVKQTEHRGALSHLCKTAAVMSTMLVADQHAALAANNSPLTTLHTAQLWLICGGAFLSMAGGLLLICSKKWGVRAIQASGMIAGAAVIGPIAVMVLAIVGFWGLDKLFEYVQAYASGTGAL